MASTPNAVIDTSFWSLACTVGLERYLWTDWPIIAAPSIVYAELFHQAKNRPQQQLFQSRLQSGHVIIHDPQTLIPTLSKGERSVVSLALELHIPALLDDYRPHRHAAQLGVQAISVVQVLISLLYRGILTVDEAERMFRQLAQPQATSSYFLQWAAQHIRAQGGTVSWP